MSNCRHCGGDTVWSDEAASEICTGCGTLTDSAQIVLTNQVYLNDSTHYAEFSWDPATTLKNPRTSWALAGQGQEARDRKNAHAMANYIKSLAVSLNASALASRAIAIFSHAKAIGYFRWGRRAKVVAGASLVIALRESSRPDSIQDISVLLKCSPNLLSRTFISVTSALNITTNPVDPSVFITTLQSYLAATLLEHQVESGLPAALLTTLQPLSLHAVTHTATSLCNVLSRLCPFDGVSKPSAASSACAVYMLSIEAEVRSTLNSLGELGKFLGARLRIGKGVVMAQYKVIQDQVASLIDKVPWLAKYQSHKGRAKVAKRTIVARGLKDVIKFNEELLHNVLLPEFDLELSAADESEEQDDAEDADTAVERATTPLDARPLKRRKLHHSLDEATRFLLNPLGNANPSHHGSNKNTLSTISASIFPLTSYVLSTSSLSSVSRKPPTRLQLLAAERGGSDQAAILDDELFVPGELEGFLRDEKEAVILQKAFGWDVDSDEDDNAEEEECTPKAKRCRKAQSNGEDPPPKKSRLNLEALAQFMGRSSSPNPEGPIDAQDEETEETFEEEANFDLLGLDNALSNFDYDDEDEDRLGEIIYDDDNFSGSTSRATYSSASSHHEEEEIVVDGWRPASPTFGGNLALDTQYEEEYD